MTQRKAIRHAVSDLLGAVPAVRGNVHASRALPVPGDLPYQLPCVLVYTDRDQADKANDYTSRRTLTLRVMVIARGDDAADDQLDDICDSLESAIEGALDGMQVPASALSGLVESCDYVDTALTYAGEEGRSEYVHAEMQYSVRYYRTPAQTLDVFGTANVEIDMGNPRNDPQTDVGPDGQVDAAATIVLES